MARDIKAHRIVVKVGTNTLTDSRGNLNLKVMKSLVDQIVQLKKNGKEVILVTSGAIGAGMKELGISSRPQEVVMRQVCAAIGQNILMGKYHDLFSRHGINVAQILLSYDAFSERGTYLNLRESISRMFKLGVVPIINENDPISIDEIGPSFGDNDYLSSLVASKVDADLLVILTNVSGLYTKNPDSVGAELISEVHDIDKKIESISGGKSALGTGGIQTKINAAKVATHAGVCAVIANGAIKDVLLRVTNNEDIGTIFYPKESLPSKKRWIMHAKPKGTLHVDKGAKEALLSGKSLLAAGVKRVSGKFMENDVVEIACSSDVFAKCICNYSSEELEWAKGRKNEEILKILGKKNNIAVRDNLVLM